MRLVPPVARGLWNVLLSATFVACAHVGGPSGAAEGEGKARRRPLVYVQDFFKLFPGYEVPKLDTVPLTMGQLYKESVCVGEPEFVRANLNVPRSYCRRPERVPRIMGAKEHDEATAFDEFMLERVLLARFRTSRLRCSTEAHGDDWCRDHADIVVIPSVELNSLSTEGLSARAANRYGIHTLRRATFVPGMHTTFWDKVKELYFKPEQGYTPFIVLSQGYSNFLASAAGLVNLPVEFQSRVIFLTTSSETTAEHLFPKVWNFKHVHPKAAMLSHSPQFVTMPHPTSLARMTDFMQDSDGYDASKTRPILITMQSSTYQRPRPATHSNDHNSLKNVVLDQIEAEGGKYGILCDPSSGKESGAICGLGWERTMWEQVVSSTFCLELPGSQKKTKAHFYAAVLSGCIPVIFDRVEGDNYIATNWAWRAPVPESNFTSALQIGDGVRMVSDRQALVDAFGESRAFYHDKMEAMLGRSFEVLDVLDHADLVALPSADGSQQGIWYFPTKTVSLISPVRAHFQKSPYIDYRNVAVVFNSATVASGQANVVEHLMKIAQIPERMHSLRMYGKKAASVLHYRKTCDTDCFDAFSNLEVFLTNKAGFEAEDSNSFLYFSGN